MCIINSERWLVMVSSASNLISAGNWTGGQLTVKEVSRCSTRGESQGTNIMSASMVRIRQPILALKPRGRSPEIQNRIYVAPK